MTGKQALQIKKDANTSLSQWDSYANQEASARFMNNQWMGKSELRDSWRHSNIRAYFLEIK